MTPTGIIAEEYVDSLGRLQKRLSLSQEDAVNMMSLVVRNRLKPIITGLYDQYLSKSDPSKRKEKLQAAAEKKQGDPISSLQNTFGFVDDDEEDIYGSAQKSGGGPNTFMREALNLVDFFQRNFKVLNVDLNTSGDLPVTATGIRPEGDLIELLKHYIITRISERDESLRRRYISEESFFALALGIPLESLGKIKQSLAFDSFKKLFKNILRVKDSLTPQDVQQFAVLKESLELPRETMDRIYYDASRTAAIEHCKAIFDAATEGVRITGDVAKKLRVQV